MLLVIQQKMPRPMPQKRFQEQEHGHLMRPTSRKV
jgi:hypothetical protein